MSKGFKEILTFINQVLNNLENKYREIDSLRNKIYSKSRELITYNRSLINSLFNNDFNNAEKLTAEIVKMLNELYSIIVEYDDRQMLYKIFKDVMKESIESILFYIYLTGNYDLISNLLRYDEAIIIESYFEFLGEVRRLYIDNLINDDIRSASNHLNFLSSSYHLLSSRYFPNYFISDYKRRLDQLRTQLERSKEDFIYVKFRGAFK